MAKKPDLEDAYGLEGSEDSRRLYADWAATYDRDFAADMDYRLPRAVAEAYAQTRAGGPVLDVGAGTGLVGEVLAELGIGPVIGIDLSPEMLEVANTKGVYERVSVADVTKKLEGVSDLAGAVSAGTFTHGHVGPEALRNVLEVVRPGGWFVASVNLVHWQNLNFARALAGMADLIDETITLEADIYGPGAAGDHASDQAILLQLKRA